MRGTCLRRTLLEAAPLALPAIGCENENEIKIGNIMPCGGCACSKLQKDQESIEFSAPQSYRHQHDHPSIRPRFPALIPGSQPRFAGARTRRPATSVDRPAPATPWPASALRHPPAALGVALPTLPAGP